MKTLSIRLICIISIFSLTSCEKENKKDETVQEIFFEHYAINYAWGLSYVHWIIDNKGNVRVNKTNDSIIWISPDKLNEYVERFDTVIFKVDKNELDYYINLIPDAAKGEVTQTEQNRADFGGTVFNCYKQESDSYEVVVLSEMSDVMDKMNLDSNAVKIDNWLKDLHVQIYSNE